MKKIIIAALTPTGKMGLDNKMPWHIPAELKLFKKITTGNTVIMGRKTYEAIGGNLSNRVNIVITSKKWESKKIIFAKNLEIALEKAYTYKKNIFIIGGRQVFQKALPLVDELFISWIKKDYTADLYFPTIDWEDWHKYYEKEFSDFIHSRYKRI